ncbi:GNAT family N-acetyltransferase [Aquimarina sediminis]|uniref:GNAT family N-acetyltransferase n=1 Tax=Aquimarina sediminis TaxID=2070536 RepID=UPI000CA08CA3|nr:GNAT family N-acetyltransferase [Aquimarina sediminis]
MNIRFALEKDIVPIVELCQAHAAFEKVACDATNKQELLSKYLFHSSSILKCIVVEWDTEIVGYATFMKQFSTWDASFYIYLDCLFLKEKTRGMGLGTQLMRKIKEYARLENCKVIQWQTPDFNVEAINFYHKIGGISKSKERFFWHI